MRDANLPAVLMVDDLISVEQSSRSRSYILAVFSAIRPLCPPVPDSPRIKNKGNYLTRGRLFATSDVNYVGALHYTLSSDLS